MFASLIPTAQSAILGGTSAFCLNMTRSEVLLEFSSTGEMHKVSSCSGFELHSATEIVLSATAPSTRHRRATNLLMTAHSLRNAAVRPVKLTQQLIRLWKDKAAVLAPGQCFQGDIDLDRLTIDTMCKPSCFRIS